MIDDFFQQGGDDTFGGFPDHLRALVSHALPNISVKVVIYPKFETRGDLHECVGRFVEWYVHMGREKIVNDFFFFFFFFFTNSSWWWFFLFFKLANAGYRTS